jgi:hypothetical protein
MTRRTLLSGFAIGCSVAVVLGLVFSPTILWDGDWVEEEYRFTFVGRGGQPVGGVQLRVENEAGTTFYHFPVCDYLPGHAPASGSDGVLVFHHAPGNGVGGKVWLLFGLIPIAQDGPPTYVCRFLLGGREVHRVRYNDLVNTGGRTVRRRWKWPTWPELQEQVFQGVDLEQAASGHRPNINVSGPGSGYAAYAADRALERSFDIMAGRRPEWEDVKFRLVERTVVLDLP